MKSTSGRSTFQGTVLPLGFSSPAGFVAFCGFALLIFIAPYLFSGFWPSSYEYWSYALFLAVVACICALLALEPVSENEPDNQPVVALLLVLFFVWSAASVAGTAYLHDSLLELARVGGVLICFFLSRAFLAPQNSSNARLLLLVSAALLGGVVVCVPAIYDFFVTRNPRQFGTFYNPNLFANYSAMLLPLALSKVLLHGRKYFQQEPEQASEPSASPFAASLAAAAFLILTLGLIVTSSKGGFLAALCAVLVFIAAVYRAEGERVKAVIRARKPVFLGLFLLLLIGGGALFSQTILPRLSSNLESDHSTMFRIYTWQGTWKMAQARPFLGWGIGSFPTVYTQFAQTGYTRSVHQSWLQIAAESGFPAMLLLLGVCGWSFARGWRKLKEESSKIWPITAGSLAALVAFCVHGLTDSGWGVVSIGVLLSVIWSVLDRAPFSASAPASAASLQIQDARSAVRWPFLLLALPLALGSWVYQRAQNAEDLRAESRETMARGLSSSAIEQARQATEADPLSARIWMNLAQAQRATGNSATSAWEKVLSLQPMRALNHADFAEYLVETNGEASQIREQFEQAIRLDPHDPQIRSTYSAWLLENGDPRGWQQLEKIVSLTAQPYGKYPATPEIVDLNFARAYTKLAERAAGQGKNEEAQKLIESGLEQIATARQYEAHRREMEAAVHGAPDETRAQELDQLELQLRTLEGF